MEGLDDVETYTTGDDELDEDLQAVIDQFHVSEGDTEDETDCDAEDVSLGHDDDADADANADADDSSSGVKGGDAGGPSEAESVEKPAGRSSDPAEAHPEPERTEEEFAALVEDMKERAVEKKAHVHVFGLQGKVSVEELRDAVRSTASDEEWSEWCSGGGIEIKLRAPRNEGAMLRVCNRKVARVVQERILGKEISGCKLGSEIATVDTLLFVGNLAPCVESGDLERMFKSYGRIDRAFVMRDTVSGRSKGYGFVDFSTTAESTAAKAAFEKVVHMSRLLRVEWADCIDLSSMHSRVLYVSQLPASMTQAEKLKAHLEAAGKIVDVVIALHPNTRASRQYAFVECEDALAAESIRVRFHNTKISNLSFLSITYANPSKSTLATMRSLKAILTRPLLGGRGIPVRGRGMFPVIRGGPVPRGGPIARGMGMGMGMGMGRAAPPVQPLGRGTSPVPAMGLRGRGMPPHGAAVALRGGFAGRGGLFGAPAVPGTPPASLSSSYYAQAQKEAAMAKMLHEQSQQLAAERQKLAMERQRTEQQKAMLARQQLQMQRERELQQHAARQEMQRQQAMKQQQEMQRLQALQQQQQQEMKRLQALQQQQQQQQQAMRMQSMNQRGRSMPSGGGPPAASYGAPSAGNAQGWMGGTQGWGGQSHASGQGWGGQSHASGQGWGGQSHASGVSQSQGWNGASQAAQSWEAGGQEQHSAEYMQAYAEAYQREYQRLMQYPSNAQQGSQQYGGTFNQGVGIKRPGEAMGWPGGPNKRQRR